MAYADLTPAERQNLSRLAHIAATETHRAREDFGAHGKDTARIFLGNAYVTIDDVLTALAAALPAGTPDPLKAVVSNGATAPLKNSAGTAVGAAATLTVAASALTEVKLPATTAAVVTGSTVAVQNSAGASAGNGTVTVAAGGVSNVKLPATVAPVTSGVKINAGTVTGTGNFATVTVAAGVVTGIVLSAS